MTDSSLTVLWLLPLITAIGCSDEAASGQGPSGGVGGRAAPGGAGGSHAGAAIHAGTAGTGGSGMAGRSAGAGSAGAGGTGTGLGGKTSGGSLSSGGLSAAGGSSAAGSSAGSPVAGGAGGVPVTPCEGTTCHFVRSDASGRADGTDWTNAWTELPAALERGHTYHVADGDYPGYGFDHAASGSAVITVRKATPAQHGSDVGWQVGFGDGRASFGPLVFSQPYYVFDGASPSASRILGTFQGDVVTIGADHVVFRNTDVDGDFALDGSGQHTQGACTGISVGGSYVTVEDTLVHDVADDGVSIADATDVTFHGNTVHALHACGTDGGCGPCYNGHSDGFEIYDLKHSVFDANFVYDVRSTSTFFFGNWADSLGAGPSEYCEDILLTNNLLYAPEVGLVAYVQDAVGIRLYHNVIWGVRQGRYGGLSVGLHVTDLSIHDNIILSINLEHTGATFDPDQHRGDYNLFGVSLGQWQDGAHDLVALVPGLVGIPGADGPAAASPTAADFALTAGSPCIDTGYAGAELVGLPNLDFYGRSRGALPDIGAIEY